MTTKNHAFKPGDRVSVNNRCSHAPLIGLSGTVAGYCEREVSVDFGHPPGYGPARRYLFEAELDLLPTFKPGDKVIVVACALHEHCSAIGAAGTIKSHEGSHWRVALDGGGYAMCTEETMKHVPATTAKPLTMRLQVNAIGERSGCACVVASALCGDTVIFGVDYDTVRDIHIGDTYTVTITKAEGE